MTREVSMRSLLLSLGLATVVHALPLTAQPGDETRCDYTRRAWCGPDGCEEFSVTDEYLLVPAIDVLINASPMRGVPGHGVEVRRCDSQGCTPVAVDTRVSGLYLSAGAVSNGYLMKLVIRGSGDLGLIDPELRRLLTAANRALAAGHSLDEVNDALADRGAPSYEELVAMEKLAAGVDSLTEEVGTFVEMATSGVNVAMGFGRCAWAP